MPINSFNKVVLEISATSANLVHEVGKANKSLSLLEKTANRVSSTFQGALVGVGVYGLINAFGNAIKTIADFDKSMTQVRVITGATGRDFERLEASALKLGSTTQYTAKQVSELQLEFGRLGFSTKEILQSTGAVVDLATATGEGLARSAEIAGSTLRAFNLDASEMGRVTDIMAASLNASALTLDTFADGIKYVAPVAAATNVTLEETAAMMSVLADAGIKGTQAGTSLRRIFTLLTDTGKPLQQRLDELAKAGITLANANDEVGLYAQTALLVLANQKDRVDKLSDSYRAAIGTTNDMARAMEDNLATSLTKTRTAWDALILSFKESKGVIRGIADGIAFVLNQFAGSEAAKIADFELQFRRFQNAIAEGRSIKGDNTVLGELLKTSEELGVELTVVRNELGEVISLQKLVRSGLTGPSPDNGSEILKIGAAAFAKSQAEKLAAYQKERALQLQIIKDGYERYQLERSITEEIRRRVTEVDPEALKKQFGFGSEFGLGATPFDSIESLGIEFPEAEEVDNKVQSIIDGLIRVRDQATETRFAFAQFADQVGNSITQVIQREMQLGQAFARVTASILDGIQQRIVAKIAEGSATAFAANPFLGIAVVTAGFAVAKGLLGMISKSGGGAGGSRPNQGYSENIRGGRVEVYGRFEMSGRTAVALVRSGSYSNAQTG